MQNSPINVGELVLCHASLHGEGDIEGATRRHCSAYPRHGHGSDVIHADVSCRLGDEHEGLVEAEQMTLVGLDGALDARLLMMADEVARWTGNALATESSEDVCNNNSYWRFVVSLQLVLVL